MAAPQGGETCSDGQARPAVQWQWEHRTGFKDYDKRVCQRIEAAYQRGDSHVRLKAGKMKSTPMELFFADMIQHDPITKNTRNIRRVGRDSFWRRWRRRIGGLWIAFETGRPRRMTFSQYCKMQAENLKDLDRRDTSEADMYHDSGCCAAIARSSWFAAATMVAVLLNAIWLGIDANLSDHAVIWEADVEFQVAEHCFSAIFLVELLIRFVAYRRKRDSLRDLWFVFDATLVLLMVGETWVMLPIWLEGNQNGAGLGDLAVLRVARVLRLAKLGRVARLLRYTPEVKTMLKGLLFALRSVLVTMTLLLVLLYLFGIIFKTYAEPYPVLQAKFPGVVDSMWFLLLHGTFLDAIADEVPAIRNESIILTILFLVFVFLSSLTTMNLLIGVLCEVVLNVSKRERERQAVQYLKNNLLEILEAHDNNEDRLLHKEEFELLMRNPEMHMILMNFGVDVEDLIAQKEIIFEDREVLCKGMSDDEEVVMPETPINYHDVLQNERKISFGEFMELVLRLRGGNGARVRDIVDLRDYVRQRMDKIQVDLSSGIQLSATRSNSVRSGEWPGSPAPPVLVQAAALAGSTVSPGSLPPEEAGQLAEHLAGIREELREVRERLGGLEGAQGPEKSCQGEE